MTFIESSSYQDVLPLALLKNVMDDTNDLAERKMLPQRPLHSWHLFRYWGSSTGSKAKQKPEAVTAVVGETSGDGDTFPLSAAQVGDRVCLVALNCGEAKSRFMGIGLIPGAIVEVISASDTGSVIVALQDQRLGFGADIAQQIQVAIAANQPIGQLSQCSTTSTMQPDTNLPPQSNAMSCKLREVAVGTTLKVIGYAATARDYKRKLLAMGLTPSTEIVVKRHAPLGDPTEIEVRGFHLSLRKDEADALIVSVIGGTGL